MKDAVIFNHVSKKYRLGAGQINLREALIMPLQRGLNRNRDEIGIKTIYALQDVSFSISPGEAYGLIGPNGAGKTTSLKILANIVEPTSGHVEVNGRVSALIELGAGFHQELSGRENIFLNAAILGIPQRKISILFDQIVDFSGLEEFIDTPVKRYSSGMYVRLGFSVAAHLEPDVLLVDEVLAVGDSQFRHKCVKRIEALKNAGTTIVFVSHNLYLVQSVCDSAIFFVRGQIRSQGDVLSVLNAYEDWLHVEQSVEAENLIRPDKEKFDPSDSTAVDILKVEILQKNGFNESTFNYTDEAVIVIHYLAKETIHEPKIGFYILRADGTTCCQFRSGDLGLQLDPLYKGEGRISLSINPIQLAGGAYYIDTSIFGRLDGLRLARGHSNWFYVIGQSLSHEEGGVFVPNVSEVKID